MDLLKEYIFSDKFIPYTTRENAYKCFEDIINLISNTNLSFIDISNFVKNKYSYVIYNHQLSRDITQYTYDIVSNVININKDDIIKRYSDPYKDVKERMMFRIELYKYGWDVSQIEKYICKYFLNNDKYCEDIDIHMYEIVYNNIMLKLEICKNNKTKKVGRPSFPPLIKEYIKQKHLNNIKEGMRLRYKYSDEYKKIKECLLTKDEASIIVSFLNDDTLKNKINGLTIK